MTGLVSRLIAIPQSLLRRAVVQRCSYHSLSLINRSTKSRTSFVCFPSNSSALIFHRSLFIQTQQTPNPNALKFLPGRDVLGLNGGTVDLSSLRSAILRSPLAAEIFQIDGVKGVLLGSDFISVNIEEGQDWTLIKPLVYAAIMDFYATGQPILKPTAASTTGTTGTTSTSTTSTPQSPPLSAEDEEVVTMIKELLETRIRPAVQEDGGDIFFISFNPQSGVVLVQMQGSCKGCSSSTVTLKNGIENMLMHYVPEVKAVEEWKDEELETVSNQQLSKLEQGLALIKQQQQQQQETTIRTTAENRTAA